MTPAEKAKEIMDKMKAAEPNKFIIDEPSIKSEEKNPEPVKIIKEVPPEPSVPIDNLIKEAKKSNSVIPPQGKTVSHTKLDQIKAILRGGGMDTMSVEKAAVQIKEVIEL